MTRISNQQFLLVAVLILSLLFTGGLLLGSVVIPAVEVWDGLFSQTNYSFILKEIRIPRLLTAVFAGGALSVAGLLMQTYFRNGLAGPYVLGVSAGAGLGVAALYMIGSTLGIQYILTDWGTTPIAIVGGIAILLLITFIARFIGNGTMLLIAGLMIGSFANALITVLQYFSGSEAIKKYLLWTMGNLTTVTLSELLIFIPVVGLGLFVAMLFVHPLNALLLGESEAQSLGISIKRVKLFLILIAGLLAGIITAYCGPIVFIGLAAPHIVRMILKTADHRILLPACFVTGSVVLLFCDIIAQLPGFDLQLPVNAITSFIGAPIVILIIVKNRRLAYE